MRGGAFGVHSQRMLALGKNGRLSRHSRRFLPAVPDFYTVILALYPVIPALYTVILALYPPPSFPRKRESTGLRPWERRRIWGASLPLLAHKGVNDGYA